MRAIGRAGSFPILFCGGGSRWPELLDERARRGGGGGGRIEKNIEEEVLCRWVCGYSMFVGSGHGSWRSNCLRLGWNQRRLSGAQPRGVTTPKKQSPLFAWTTWFGSTGMMTTPAEARAAAHATTTAMESCILSFLLLSLRGSVGRSGPRRANKARAGGVVW